MPQDKKKDPIVCRLGVHRWVVNPSEWMSGFMCRGCGAVRNPSRAPWFRRLACGIAGHLMEGWPTDGEGKRRLGCGRCAAMFEKTEARNG